MTPNSFGIPFAGLKNTKPEDVFRGLQRAGWFKTTVFYLTDSSFRKSVDLHRWFKSWEETKPTMVLPNFGAPSDNTALECTRWVAQNVKYAGDPDLWSLSEKWSLPDETLRMKKGDCEDGAMLLYFLLHAHGFSDDQVRIVAGDVRSGGHCYVTYHSFEDGIEYVLDWCYWPADSLKVPYGLNYNYFEGKGEWFAFNLSGSYVRK